MLQNVSCKIEQKMKHITHKYTSIIPLDLYDDNGEIDRRVSPGWRREPRILETIITLLFKHQEYCYYYQILKYNNGINMYCRIVFLQWMHYPIYVMSNQHSKNYLAIQI
eukprot:317011_1